MAKVTQAHIDARSQDILAAAMRMFASKGVAGTTMQEIATAAGLSAGAIYRYYASKVDLLRAAYGDCVRQNEDLFQQASAESASPGEALHQAGRLAWESMKEGDFREQAILYLENALAAAREPEAVGSEYRVMVLGVIEQIEQLVREAQRSGELDREADASGLASTLMAAYLGSRMLALELGPKFDTDTIFDMVCRLIGTYAKQAVGAPAAQR